MIRLVGVGDNTVDTYVHLHTMFPGGNAVNVAVLAHRLGHAAGYVGWIGNDERGELILSALKDEGVDSSHCRVFDDKKSAFSTVELVEGNRVFGASNSGACRDFRLSNDDLDYIRGFDSVHTSVYSYIEEQLPLLRSFSARLSFDFSDNTDPEYLERVLPFVDIAFISLADIPMVELAPLVRRMKLFGPGLVVATRGKEGSWAFDGQNLIHQPIVPISVLDTLGAGDAFAASFLVEVAENKSLPEAMAYAAQNAAKNCLHYGAFGHGKVF
jgi:fructoselysine 6-kinase